MDMRESLKKLVEFLAPTKAEELMEKLNAGKPDFIQMMISTWQSAPDHVCGCGRTYQQHLNEYFDSDLGQLTPAGEEYLGEGFAMQMILVLIDKVMGDGASELVIFLATMTDTNPVDFFIEMMQSAEEDSMVGGEVAGGESYGFTIIG